MLKKTITFEDLDGNSITEDFYFNLNKAEITEMELSTSGGLSEYMTKIVKENDGAKLITLFKELIVKAVGRRSPDGRRFVKNQDIVDDFIQTEAYSELFMELATKADAAVEFIKGIVPKDLNVDTDEIDKLKTQTTENLELPSAPGTPTKETDEARYDRLLTDESWEPNGDDLRKMSPSQLQVAFARKASLKKTE